MTGQQQTSPGEMFRFGIMGAGGIASKFCSAVKLIPGVMTAAVASKDLGRAERFAAANGVEHFYGNYEEMLDEEDLDAVYIATTNNFHYENVLLCIARRVPVLCEKIMFVSAEEAEEAMRLAAEKQVFMMEAMWSRFIPCVQKARQWVEEGHIGEVQTAVYTGGINAPVDHRIYDPELGGGALYDLMVYPVEILMYLVGQPVVKVCSQIVRGDTGVDVADSMILQFETCQAAVQATTRARIPSPCGLYGSKGYIRMEQTHRAQAAELYDGQFGLVERYEKPFENGFEYEIEEVVSCVRQGVTESQVMPWRDTLACIKLFEKALECG